MEVPSSLQRYLLSLDEKAIGEALSWWSGIIPETLAPLFITKFGDWFLTDADSNVVFFDLLDHSLNKTGLKVADLSSPKSFVELNEQLSVDWVEICLMKNLLLEPNQSYGWRLPPQMGGPFASSNIQVFSFRVYQHLNYQLHLQSSN